MLKDLLIKNRSYRRFYQKERVSIDTLRELVGVTRYCASGRNAQSLKYVIVNSESWCEEIFRTLAWAGYLTDWQGPEEGEKPAAYIIQLNDKDISTNYFCDDGISAQSILLCAVEQGLGGCILRAFNRARIKEIIDMPENMDIIQVIALGKPKEEVIIEDIENGDFKYWRDENQVHHVPKRTLKEILISEK